MKKWLLFSVFVPALLFSQTRKQRKAMEAQRKADQQIINNLKSHDQSLTDKNSALLSKDNLVTQYISNQFKTIGLKPKGTNGYLQPLRIDEGKKIKVNTFLKVNGTMLAVKKDYFPLSYSAQKSVTGMPVMALKERGVPWFADVKEWLEDSAGNKAFDINKTVQKEAERAALKGATALFLYNSSNTADHLRFNNKDKITPAKVPVVYITPAGYNKYFKDPSQILDVELNIAFEESIKNTNNVAAYIDNGAASDIVIAAPYNFMYPEENENTGQTIKPNDTVEIVSGTSVLIELARMLMASKAKNYNYTFISYVDENGLLPGNKWINSSPIASGANYIINFNRIGRYGEDKKLVIKSYNTPAGWIENIKMSADKTVAIGIDSSITARDTSMPIKVPVLNFSAGNENNYNKASASGEKADYDEELHIARFIYRLIEATAPKGKLASAKKNESHSALSQTVLFSAFYQKTAVSKRIKFNG